LFYGTPAVRLQDEAHQNVVSLDECLTDDSITDKSNAGAGLTDYADRYGQPEAHGFNA
jgi:hypothetical protein